LPPSDDHGPEKRPRRARKPAKPPASPIRDAASEASWVDYETLADSWDPWEEGGDDQQERGLNRTMGEWLEAVVPPEAQLHFYNAGREFAAGVQTTIEYHMRKGQPERPEDGGPVRIEIE
jgi:hypothetical protein